MENKQPDVQCQHADLAHGTSREKHLCLLISLECAVLLSSLHYSLRAFHIKSVFLQISRVVCFFFTLKLHHKTMNVLTRTSLYLYFHNHLEIIMWFDKF